MTVDRQATVGIKINLSAETKNADQLLKTLREIDDLQRRIRAGAPSASFGPPSTAQQTAFRGISNGPSSWSSAPAWSGPSYHGGPAAGYGAPPWQQSPTARYYAYHAAVSSGGSPMERYNAYHGAIGRASSGGGPPPVPITVRVNNFDELGNIMLQLDRPGGTAQSQAKKQEEKQKESFLDRIIGGAQKAGLAAGAFTLGAHAGGGFLNEFITNPMNVANNSRLTGSQRERAVTESVLGVLVSPAYALRDAMIGVADQTNKASDSMQRMSARISATAERGSALDAAQYGVNQGRTEAYGMRMVPLAPGNAVNRFQPGGFVAAQEAQIRQAASDTIMASERQAIGDRRLSELQLERFQRAQYRYNTASDTADAVARARDVLVNAPAAGLWSFGSASGDRARVQARQGVLAAARRAGLSVGTTPAGFAEAQAGYIGQGPGFSVGGGVVSGRDINPAERRVAANLATAAGEEAAAARVRLDAERNRLGEANLATARAEGQVAQARVATARALLEIETHRGSRMEAAANQFGGLGPGGRRQAANALRRVRGMLASGRGDRIPGQLLAMAAQADARQIRELQNQLGEFGLQREVLGRGLGGVDLNRDFGGGNTLQAQGMREADLANQARQQQDTAVLDAGARIADAVGRNMENLVATIERLIDQRMREVNNRLAERNATLGG
jgi:hypothetical protein